jgi:hypothetical protein
MMSSNDVDYDQNDRARFKAGPNSAKIRLCSPVPTVFFVICV